MAISILLIRHSEKPVEGGKDAGVDAIGKPDPRGLTPRGWQRAGALVRWIVPALEGVPAPIAPPTAIFAAKPSESSDRPLLTVQPLAKLLGLEIDARFRGEDAAQLVKAADAIDGVALVCWRHKYMADIARLLCPELHPVPEWDESVFDRAWLFTPVAGRWQLRELKQNLLSGDGA